jgi:hypothetical protein
VAASVFGTALGMVEVAIVVNEAVVALEGGKELRSGAIL